MRKFRTIVHATALEILSEPLSLLVLLAALAIAVLAPAFHYHQFGEATRMARDAGLSSLFTCGSVIAVFGTIRAIRREIESGTLEMALSHAVSRTVFFLGKAAGAFGAMLVFSAIVFLTASVVVAGAAVGGEIARRTGALARLWGPCLAAGVAVMILPLLLSAALNRFAHRRFVPVAFLAAFVLAALSAVAAGILRGALLLRLMGAAVPIVVLVSVLLAAAAAFAVRLKANAAASCTGLVFLLLLPAVGNYCLSDVLSGGGAVSLGYIGLSVLAAVPAAAFFLALGLFFINGRDRYE